MNVMENNYMFRPVLAIIRLSMELKLTSSLYFMCFVSLPICIMFHSISPDPCFDSVCQTMRM